MVLDGNDIAFYITTKEVRNIFQFLKCDTYFLRYLCISFTKSLRFSYSQKTVTVPMCNRKNNKPQVTEITKIVIDKLWQHQIKKVQGK